MTELTEEDRKALRNDIAANVPADELIKKYNLTSSQLFYYTNTEKEALRMKEYRAKPAYARFLARRMRWELEQVFEGFAENPFVRSCPRKIFEESLQLRVKGKMYSNPYIIAVATYSIFRKNNKPRTFDDIADSFGIPPSRFMKAYKNCYSSERLPQITVSAFIGRYAKEAKISKDIETKALELNEQHADFFMGRTPHHVAQYWICRARKEISGDGKLGKRSLIRKWDDVCQATLNLMDRQLEERLKA